MVNIRESVIKFVIDKHAKVVVIRMNQTVKEVGMIAWCSVFVAYIYLPNNSRHLTQYALSMERGNPVILLLLRTANRKECLWYYGNGMAEKANVVL